MDMSENERLRALEALFEEIEDPEIESVEELSRAEDARAARHFGFAQPQFRTSVQLRFTGEGVKGHDLNGGTAAGVIAGFTGAVDAVRADKRLPPGSANLYLSPTVSPGSTILELFGEANASTEKLDTEIDDTPVDQAIAGLFDVLAQPIGSEENGDGFEIEASVGKRLYSLSKSLIDGSVDLELSWTRPRGTRASVSFYRSSARALREFLDRETVIEQSWVSLGRLETISTNGFIEFREESSRVSMTIDATSVESPERLRSLWAQDVVASWTDTTTRHPMRDDTKVVRTLVAINPAANSPLAGYSLGPATVANFQIAAALGDRLRGIRFDASGIDAIRNWARENGVNVSAKGKISDEVVTSYLRSTGTK